MKKTTKTTNTNQRTWKFLLLHFKNFTHWYSIHTWFSLFLLSLHLVPCPFLISPSQIHDLFYWFNSTILLIQIGFSVSFPSCVHGFSTAHFRVGQSVRTLISEESWFLILISEESPSLLGGASLSFLPSRLVCQLVSSCSMPWSHLDNAILHQYFWSPSFCCSSRPRALAVGGLLGPIWSCAFQGYLCPDLSWLWFPKIFHVRISHTISERQSRKTPCGFWAQKDLGLTVYTFCCPTVSSYVSKLASDCWLQIFFPSKAVINKLSEEGLW